MNTHSTPPRNDAAKHVDPQTVDRLLLGCRPYPAWMHVGLTVVLFAAECLLAFASDNPRLVLAASIVPALLLLEAIRTLMLAQHAHRLRRLGVLARLATASHQPSFILHQLLAPWSDARRIAVHVHFAATIIACMIAKERAGLGLAVYIVPLVALLFVHWFSSPSLSPGAADMGGDPEIGLDDIDLALSGPDAVDSIFAALRSHASLIIAAVSAALGLGAGLLAFATALGNIYSAMGPPGSSASDSSPHALAGIALVLWIGGFAGAIAGGRRIRRASSEHARETHGDETALLAVFLRGARC